MSNTKVAFEQLRHSAKSVIQSTGQPNPDRFLFDRIDIAGVWFQDCESDGNQYALVRWHQMG